MELYSSIHFNYSRKFRYVEKPEPRSTEFVSFKATTIVCISWNSIWKLMLCWWHLNLLFKDSLGCQGGSISWVTYCWFWFRAWSRGHGIEPCVELCAQKGICLVFSCNSFFFLLQFFKAAYPFFGSHNVTGFVSPQARGSWSHHFEEWRGRPDKEWWAAKQSLLNNSSKLMEREGTQEVAILAFKSTDFYKLFCRTILSILSVGPLWIGHSGVPLRALITHLYTYWVIVHVLIVFWTFGHQLSQLVITTNGLWLFCFRMFCKSHSCRDC